ncbi:MAG TPA: DUF2911 domain-containing protein [Planctomycetota bacterium]|nr:DUF2911 domain-containing protein [Planctomycetota bacterium]
MKTTTLCSTVVAAALLSTSLLSQQEPAALTFPQPSPAATITQRVGLTDIEIKYCRPSAKGRAIFGGLVPYGELWRTGANAATTISFSTDVKLEGQPVPAGAYSLFTIPDAKEWTVILNTVVEQSGTYEYDQSKDLLRVKVKPVALPAPVETFRIAIDELKGGAATLSLAWEQTAVPLKLDTDLVALLVPRIQAAMAGEGKKPYFQAAMFYYENGLDLKLATQWIEAAVQEQPDAVWMVYRKGLILAKAGDKPGALAAANRSLELAKQAGGSLGAEYTRLNEQLIASLK